MYKLDSVQKHEYPTLLAVWESSVKATHHFLEEGGIDVLKKLILDNDIFSLANLTCARDNDNEIVGFMGTSGGSLEMLFISPHVMKKGVGKMLLLHAINNFNAKRVDVNEQNENAVKFYEHFGFQTISKDELDDFGNPYPLLHMQLK